MITGKSRHYLEIAKERILEEPESFDMRDWVREQGSENTLLDWHPNESSIEVFEKAIRDTECKTECCIAGHIFAHMVEKEGLEYSKDNSYSSLDNSYSPLYFEKFIVNAIVDDGYKTSDMNLHDLFRAEHWPIGLALAIQGCEDREEYAKLGAMAIEAFIVDPSRFFEPEWWGDYDEDYYDYDYDYDEDDLF